LSAIAGLLVKERTRKVFDTDNGPLTHPTTDIVTDAVGPIYTSYTITFGRVVHTLYLGNA